LLGRVKVVVVLLLLLCCGLLKLLLCLSLNGLLLWRPIHLCRLLLLSLLICFVLLAQVASPLLFLLLGCLLRLLAPRAPLLPPLALLRRHYSCRVCGGRRCCCLVGSCPERL
jgi:hypothetical protein